MSFPNNNKNCDLSNFLGWFNNIFDCKQPLRFRILAILSLSFYFFLGVFVLLGPKISFNPKIQEKPLFITLIFRFLKLVFFNDSDEWQWN
jgi:hypothetical protein